MSQRRATDRESEDHRDERAPDPVLAERVARLASDVESPSQDDWVDP